MSSLQTLFPHPRCLAYVHEVLSYGQRWGDILPLADALCDADAATAATLSREDAAVALVLGCDCLVAAGDFVRAREHLARAAEVVREAAPTSRGAAYVRAWQQWLVEGSASDASRTLRSAVLAAHPDDLFAVKRAQLFAFLVGQTEAMVRACKNVVPAWRSLSDDDWLRAFVDAEAIESAAAPLLPPALGEPTLPPFLAGMLAFALEQHRLARVAECVARLGVRTDPHDVWAQHALAHALFFTARWDESIVFLEAHRREWRSRMSFLYTHCHMHLALALLHRDAAGDVARVCAVLDDSIWPYADASARDAAAAAEAPPSSRASRPLSPPPPERAFFPRNARGNLQDQLNALSVLFALDARRVVARDARSEWFLARLRDVCDAATASAFDATLDPLYDSHVVYALARCGRLDDAERHVDAVRSAAVAAGDAERRAQLLRVVAPLCEAIVASVRALPALAERATDGDAPAAAERDANKSRALALASSAVLDELAVVGGSSEQRVVLHDWFAALR